MKHYDCHTCLKAHIHKDQATTRQQTDFACKSNQWKHDTLKWNQHRTGKYQKNNLTCFGFITYKYPGRHSRYQQHQNRCHYRDKQRIHKRSYVIQFLKRILIVFKCECSFRRKLKSQAINAKLYLRNIISSFCTTMFAFCWQICTDCPSFRFALCLFYSFYASLASSF